MSPRCSHWGSDEWKSFRFLSCASASSEICVLQTSWGAGFAGDALRSSREWLRRRQWDHGVEIRKYPFAPAGAKGYFRISTPWSHCRRRSHSREERRASPAKPAPQEVCRTQISLDADAHDKNLKLFHSSLPQCEHLGLIMWICADVEHLRLRCLAPPDALPNRVPSSLIAHPLNEKHQLSCFFRVVPQN